MGSTVRAMDLAQDGQLNAFLSMGDGPWTVAHDSQYEPGQRNFGIYCALSDSARRDKALSDPGWDLRVTDGRPGFVQHWEADEEVTTYVPSGWFDEGLEPLVIVRSFHGAAPNVIELDQQFRLYHNLRHDRATDRYYKMNEDGTQTLASEVLDNATVRIRTPLLRQYIAARQVDLLLFIDSVMFGDPPAGDLPEMAEFKSDTAIVQRSFSRERLVGRKHFTRLLGTKVIKPGPRETCGIWPFEALETFPEFIIGEDEHGQAVTHTCNPDLLGDYFGGNPDAPHYLTPVHFRKEVLQKYYDRPELYEVRAGYLSCAGLWGVDIDNDHDDRVVVFLGDLGRDLPASERDYWRGFMIPPDASISESNFRRSFLGQFAEAASVDLRFRQLYAEANAAWKEAFGWPPFREMREGDVYLLQQVRLPLNDSQKEFEAVVSILAKLLCDGINEKELRSRLDGKVNDEKGISKLERYLRSAAYPSVDRDIPYLRRVQELRSKLAAHVKGADHEAILTKNLGALRGMDAIRSLLESGNQYLESLAEFAQARRGAVAAHGEPEPVDE